MNPIELLKHEHKIILGVLSVLKKFLKLYELPITKIGGELYAKELCINIFYYIGYSYST